MGTGIIPDIVIGRLPIYLRALTRMAAEGLAVTSSHDLGRRLGISSAQIRKDLSHFGEFGKQGTGYKIEYLVEQLRRILKVDREWDVVLVGVGDLGRALAHYNGFRNRGFVIGLIFDSDPAKIGTQVGSLPVLDIAELEAQVRARNIRVAMVAVPASAAQGVVDVLIRAGVRAVLNYAPTSLSVPEGVNVQNIDPAVHLQRMTYYL